MYQTEGWGNNQLERFVIDLSSAGKLVMVPYTSTWYRDYRGVLVYKEVSSDFVVTTDLAVNETRLQGTFGPASRPPCWAAAGRGLC